MQRDLERVTEVYENRIGEVHPGQLDHELRQTMILLVGVQANDIGDQTGRVLRRVNRSR